MQLPAYFLVSQLVDAAATLGTNDINDVCRTVPSIRIIDAKNGQAGSRQRPLRKQGQLETGGAAHEIRLEDAKVGAR